LQSFIQIGLIILLPVGIILLQNDTGSALVFSAFILVLYREGLSGWVLVFLVFMAALFILVLIFDATSMVVVLFGLTMLLFVLITRRLKEAVRFTVALLGVGVILWGISEFLDIHIPMLYILLIPIGIGIPVALVYAYLSRTRVVYLLTGLLFLTISSAFSVDYVFHKVLDIHHQKRITDLLGIEADPLGWGYNVNQSKIAIGSGGFWGKGYLGGTQTKFNFVPEQSTDFIFCTVGEEWGFVGSAAIITLFVILLLRIIRIAERQRETFARAYGYGVMAILFFHIAVNVGMTIGLFPVIGIPLPFFSYGGSSLWAFTILLFILLKLDSTRLGY
jgi:rod shape determining protein RodA